MRTLYYSIIVILLSTGCGFKVIDQLNLKNINFLQPEIMGILNLTPDSFSDGGKFNNYKKAKNHIIDMIKAGANIIDIGGESTRPGSKTVLQNMEWKRIENIVKNFKF